MLSVWHNTRGEVFFPEFKYSLGGAFKHEQIYGAWQDLVAKLPILRTAFVPSPSHGVPFLQVVLSPGQKSQELTNDARHEVLKRFASLIIQPFGDGDGWVLRLKIHHALYDAVSLAIINNCFSPAPGQQIFARLWD